MNESVVERLKQMQKNLEGTVKQSPEARAIVLQTYDTHVQQLPITERQPYVNWIHQYKAVNKCR
jgi:uncharacterized protein (DUF1501 family)